MLLIGSLMRGLRMGCIILGELRRKLFRQSGSSFIDDINEYVYIYMLINQCKFNTVIINKHHRIPQQFNILIKLL